MENKKEIVLDETNQSEEENALEEVEQQESSKVNANCLEEININKEIDDSIETDTVSEDKTIENAQILSIEDNKEKLKQSEQVDANEIIIKEQSDMSNKEEANIIVQEVAEEKETEEKSEINNIKSSLMKAADQIKETDVYGQIKKSNLYSKVKDMFVKIKQNDFEFSFSKREQWVALGIIVAVILFDQVTKIIASNLLMEYESYEIIDHFFYFTFIYNPGMAWGTLEGMRWLFVIVTPFILLFILHIFVYSKKHEIYTRAGMLLVIAGAIGNWIDRLFIGEVRDFIHFIIPIIEYDFPIFNIADIAVVVGMGLVILEVIIQEYQIWKLSKSL